MSACGDLVADLLIVHASELLTLDDGKRTPRTGARLRDLGIIEDGAIACANGEVILTGRTDDVTRAVRLARDATLINAEGRVVLPGFVDAHTHFAFCGGREVEYERRLQGATYEQIAREGGGIHSTVRAVREAGESDLAAATRTHLDAMLRAGTTTAEGKSGYGLYLEHEMRLLQVMEDVARTHPVTVVRTFLAHDIPPDDRAPQKRRAYVQMIADAILPAVRDTRLAQFADVFCDRGAFTIAESRAILRAARTLGFELKLHADELANTGAARLAAEVGALSADHLCQVTPAGIAALREKKVMPVLLPGTSLGVGLRPAPARQMVEAGLAVCVATDYNPGTNPCESVPMAIALACTIYKLTPAEAIVGATYNAAHAIGLGGVVGTLATGAAADMVILDMESYRHLPYHYGVSHVYSVIKSGTVVVQ